MTYGVDTVRPAVVAIDLHRGHLDSTAATMPVPDDVAQRVIDANQRFFRQCRMLGIPIVHLVTTYRDVAEIRSNPFWRSIAEAPGTTRKNTMRHNLAGSPGCEIIPGLFEPGQDWVVNTKKRYNCFAGTDLDVLLRTHGINTLLITGVNTNSCVLATVTGACSRDYAVIVIEDCVDTMDGPELHAAALACIRTAFGWVAAADEVLAELAGVASFVPSG